MSFATETSALTDSDLVVETPVHCINKLTLRNYKIVFCGGRETEKKRDWRIYASRKKTITIQPPPLDDIQKSNRVMRYNIFCIKIIVIMIRYNIR